MLNTYLSTFFIIILLACGDSNPAGRKDGFSDAAKSPEDSLFQEVMDGHDEAMAKMGRLKGYRQQAEQKLDSLSKIKGSRKAAEVSSFSNLQQDLKNAEDGMNKWMADFQIDSAQDVPDKRIQYLSDEKKKVEKVRDDILSVLARADSVLNRK